MNFKAHILDKKQKFQMKLISTFVKKCNTKGSVKIMEDGIIGIISYLHFDIYSKISFK